METYNMSVKEINQVAVFEQLARRDMKQKHASQMFGLCLRQIQRKLQAYRQEGPVSLAHKSRGRPSNHRLPDSLTAKAIRLVKDKYTDFGPTLASEKLAELHRLNIHPDTLRKAMIKAGVWQTRQQRKKYWQRRERKACLGEMVQFDGSHHAWFEDRAPQCCLLAFIDDATNNVFGQFAKSESTLTAMRLTKEYLQRYGRPLAIYADRGKVTKVNQNNPDDEFTTQYRRAMEAELKVKIIFALSPQAKGRVERLFKTFQDRVIKEMRLRNISSIAQGNEFLTQYLPVYNQRFSVPPKEKANLHRGIAGYKLDNILCVKQTRKLKNDYTIAYNNQWFQLSRQQSAHIYPGDTITVRTHMDKSISLAIRGIKLNYTQLLARPQVAPKHKPKQITSRSNEWKPSSNHPWKQFNYGRRCCVAKIMA